MATPTIKGRKMRSISDVRKSSKSGGGSGFIKYISADGVTVRFLTEPDEWWGYEEHYDEAAQRAYPCTEGDCPGCKAGVRGTMRYLAPAVNREDDGVLILKIPKTLASDMVSKYDRRKTITDRDYFLYKEGTGKNDTRYKVDDEEKTRFNADKYKLPDIEAALMEMWNSVNGDDIDADDDEDERPARKRRVPVPRDDDDDEDDGSPNRRKKPVRKPVRKAGRKTSAARRIKR